MKREAQKPMYGKCPMCGYESPTIEEAYEKNALLDEVLKMRYPFSAKDSNRLHDIAKRVQAIAFQIEKRGKP